MTNSYDVSENASCIFDHCTWQVVWMLVNGSQGYDEVMTKGHWCPPRLCGRNDSLVEAVNDWHFAMLHLSNVGAVRAKPKVVIHKTPK